MKSVGVVDIAREAGVSTATVSRVLNGSAKVSEKTREHVMAVIDRYDFRLNVSASTLRRGRSMTVGLAVASISQPWYVKLIRELRKAITEHGYTTVVYDLEHDSRVLIEHTESARTLKLAGMVVATGDRLDEVEVRESLERLAASVPLVVIGQKLPNAHWSTVQFDDASASEDAARELLASRGRPLLFLGTSPRSYLAEERAKGVRRALESFPDVRGASRFYELGHQMDFRAGYVAAKEVGEGLRDYGSVFCVNDELALGVCRRAREIGIRVPQDLLVLGYGDIDVLPYVTPSLSSVSGDANLVAADALEALLAGIDGTGDAFERVHTREIVHRESTSTSR